MQPTNTQQRIFDLLERSDIPGHMKAWANKYARDHYARISWDARYITENFKGRRVLNIGGCPYLLEAELASRGDYDITTIDLEPERFQTLIDGLGINVLKCDIEDLEEGDFPGAADRFDIVVLCEVFEHLRIDLLSTISSLGRFLRDDGVLYVTTPNGRSLFALARNTLQQRTGPSLVLEWSKLRDIGHMGHVREYSAKEVKEVVSHCGFALDNLIYRNILGRRGLIYLVQYVMSTIVGAWSRDMVLICRKPPQRHA